jgi:hypothetical protein
MSRHQTAGQNHNSKTANKFIKTAANSETIWESGPDDGGSNNL